VLAFEIDPVGEGKYMIPSDIQLHRLSRTLTLEYGSGESFTVATGFLRLHSSSAASKYNELAVEEGAGKCLGINIVSIDTVGNYALRLGFDDGHDSGIYTWDYLYELVSVHWQAQQQYFLSPQAGVDQADQSAQKAAPVVQLFDPKKA